MPDTHTPELRDAVAEMEKQAIRCDGDSLDYDPTSYPAGFLRGEAFAYRKAIALLAARSSERGG